MKKIRPCLTLSLVAILLTLSSHAKAEITLIDKDDWKVGFYGFVEIDAILDSKGTLGETPGSAPVPLPNSYYGNSGRAVMSMRNSRFGFSLTAPLVEGLKTRGVLEMDFLGFDPNPNTAVANGPVNSETSFNNNPTLRMRHAYMTAGQDNWQILLGQTWSVFGWQPANFLTTSDVSPVPGMLFQRTSQITYSYTAKGEESDGAAALSFSRPATRASNIPTIDGGVRYTYKGRKAGFSANNGDIKLVGTSLGLSGTYRVLAFPGVPAAANSVETSAGYGTAIDAIVPILTTSTDSPAGTLVITGEVSSGRGYADHVGGFTGNLAGASNTATSTSPDVDAGLAGTDAAGHWQPIDLLVWNAQAQYHLPGEMHSFVDIGYGQTFSDNVAALKAGSAVPYNKSDILFVNVFHDWTKSLRSSVEYAQLTTSYTDSEFAIDNRYMFTSYFRF